MNDREKLIELIDDALAVYDVIIYARLNADEIADHLIANSVTIQKHGRWIMRGGKRYCSKCGNSACVTRDPEDFWYTVGTDYCPNCGARMENGNGKGE